MVRGKNNGISPEMKKQSNDQLNQLQRNLSYDTKDYTIELLVQKLDNHDFFIPDYQRSKVWTLEDKSLFIESVLLGLPSPFIFLSDTDDTGDEDNGGRLEIIDGVQRTSTLSEFIGNKFTLKGLKKLDTLNGFSFSDLSETHQRRFRNRTIKTIVLSSNTPIDARSDIFSRINRGGKQVTDAEYRRGAFPGMLTNFIDECAKDSDFISLTTISKKRDDRYERFELALRFFAYREEYKSVKNRVAPFLNDYLIRNQNSFDIEAGRLQFRNMCRYAKQMLGELGFSKSGQTPRVRFEALAVGISLAIEENPNVKQIQNPSWLTSKEFCELTTSDASNNSGKLRKRIEFVYNKIKNGEV